MHEYAVVEQLVEQVLRHVRRQGRREARVTQVHLRLGSIFAAGPLQQAYQVLTVDTPLAGSTLVVEEAHLQQQCDACNRPQEVTPDDLLGHLFFCPACGALQEVDETRGVELVGVTMERPPRVVARRDTGAKQ